MLSVSTVERDYPIIDSHSHWGASLSMGTNVSTQELLSQQAASGVSYVCIIPFPSTAIADNEINVRVLNESRQIDSFIPYFYLREDFPLIPEEYPGGKWHWMRGWQDAASNYKVLDDPELPGYIDGLTRIGKPIIFEEELAFTQRFVDMAHDLPLIVPHLGMLGGNPHDFLESFKNKANVYFDTALGAKGTIFDFVRTIGPERVLFGSDVPFSTMMSELPKVTTLSLSDEDIQLLLYGNIKRLAKLNI